MAIGIVGRKCGMTRIFDESGKSIPVTVIHAEPNRIAQLKTHERDGYQAIQVTTGERRPIRVTKQLAGHCAKANIAVGEITREFRLPEDADINENWQLGKSITVDIFTTGQIVDVQGTSKGKGFAGVIKRHHFSMQDASHGNSLSHRAPGSCGQNQSPGRVFKGKKMAGQMGNVTRTTQNLEIIRVDAERNLLLVKGGVPGADGSFVIVKPAIKQRRGEQ